MKENAHCLKNKIIRDKIFTSNEEINEENKNQNFPFNLEYHKIINIQDGQSKFNTELQKLIDFVKNSSHYRDLDGNRIVSKGQLAPTPYQRLEKVNQGIKDFYENKLKIRSVPLIVKNSRNRIMEDNFNVFNKSKISDKNDTKSKNYYSLKKYLKTFEKPNINKVLSNSSSVKSNKDGTSNITISSIINKFKLSPPTKSNINDSDNIFFKSNENNKLLSETYNNYKTSFFKDIQLSQSNFRKPKILFPQSLTKYNRDNFFKSQKKFSKYNNYITEYNKSNREKMDNLLFRIDRNDIYNILSINKKTFYLNNKTNKSMTKVKNVTKEINNRDIMQFNIDQMFKQDKKYENKIVLNTMPSKGNFINLKMEKNKKINVNVYDINSFGFNKNMAFKSSSERIDNVKIIPKQKTYKSFDTHKRKKDFSN